MKRLSLYSLFLLAFIVSCSGKKEVAKTDFTYSLGNLTSGINLTGGLYLWAINVDPETGTELETLKLDLVDSAAEIPFGSWKFFIVGYEGPEAWAGNQYCGSVPETLLDTDEKNVSVTISIANCSTEPIYQQMVAEKAASLINSGLFDSGLFDSSTFGP